MEGLECSELEKNTIFNNVHPVDHFFRDDISVDVGDAHANDNKTCLSFMLPLGLSCGPD